MRTDKQGLIMYQWLWYFGCCISCFLKPTFVRIASFTCCSHSEPDKSWCVKINATNRVSVTAGWVRWVDWWNCHSASRQIYFCQNIIFCVCWSKGKRQLKNENNWGGWILEFQCNIPPCGCVFYNSLQFAFTVRFNSGQRYFYHKTDIISFW